MPSLDGCSACDLAAGRVSLPGGRIHETPHRLVEEPLPLTGR